MMPSCVSHYAACTGYLSVFQNCLSKETSISLDIGNEICFDKVKVATHFNDFFTSMLPHLLTNCQRVLVSLGKATLWNFTVINMLQNICLV